MRISKITAILLLGAGVQSCGDSDRSTAQSECENEVMAFVMSQEFVERSLSNPASAEFPSITAQGVRSASIGNCRFNVSAYVDAKNALGGTVRTPYYTALQYDPASKDWNLLELEI